MRFASTLVVHLNLIVSWFWVHSVKDIRESISACNTSCMLCWAAHGQTCGDNALVLSLLHGCMTPIQWYYRHAAD